LAKDIELRDFMKYMFDTWPKCYPFKTFDVKTKNKMIPKINPLYKKLSIFCKKN
jgi:hypothetical protein